VSRTTQADVDNFEDNRDPGDESDAPEVGE
jgi:hypothetical protein